MALELDHLFVCTALDAPRADDVVRAGFVEGRPNRHAGQGTSCRRFFFANAYLEFLWVHDEREVRAAAVEPTRLWERWRYRQTGYSPFGIGLRPASGQPGLGRLPFATWGYRPPYLSPPHRIEVATNASPVEPFVFCMAAGRRPDGYAAEHEQPLAHASRAEQITGVTIAVPLAVAAPMFEAFGPGGVVRLARGGDHLAEVTLDHGRRGRRIDLRPQVPLVLRW